MKNCLTFYAAICMSACVLAAQPRAVDVKAFDLGNVRLGMDLEQARSAMAAHFGVLPSAIALDYRAEPSPLTGTKLPMRLRYESEGEELSVNLEPRLPIRALASRFAVAQVARRWPEGARSQAQIFEAARAQYGAPSGIVGQRMLWCAKPSADPAVLCLQDNPAVLAVSAKGMALFDVSWVDARVEAEMAAKAKKVQESQKAPKPH
ncbi:MAG: hypothetical protein LBJ15_11865 [Comamonas sp.]|jgi:hypothetical protein|uniref:hypothetical protein n=1 Tax=Comamonas sp. TaxID=34028 RepID=UPI002816B930|nr:hypothetical protein [Comamonas sp.]MDR0214688.1 hypothetical protein [Comamonas sp.]